MQIFRRILFFIVVLIWSGTIHSSAQLLEKAPTSPVAVDTAASRSVYASSIQVNDILLSGFKRTKPYIILREVPFKKGEILSVNELNVKLLLCKQQLMYTSLFVDVEVTPLKVDSSHVFIHIQVKERWYLFPIPYFKIVSRNFNTWWYEEKRSLSRVEYGLKFQQNNVTGRNDNLNLWFVNGFTQQMSLRYENPNMGKSLQHGLNIGFGYRRNRELNYDMDSIKPNKWSFHKNEDRFLITQGYIDLTYTYRPAIRTRHSFKAGYGSYSVDSLVVKLNPDYFGSSITNIRYFDIGYHVSYNNLDYSPYPMKGFFGEMSVDKRFGKNTNYLQLITRTNNSFRLAQKSTFQLQSVGVLRLPFTQPYVNSSLMGSADVYMRGLEYYVVQGVAGGIARATIKNELLSFNVNNPLRSKSHDKIPFRLFVKTFADLGYSYLPNPGKSIFNNKLLRTWGLGIDVITFYDVVLRFEYTFNQIGEHALFFHNQTDW